MGFFLVSPTADASAVKGASVDFLHRHGCRVCPLNNQRGLRHPHMPAYGPTDAEIYMLGESPGESEDKKGIPFVGKAGKALHLRIPEHWVDNIRFNNCVRTRPPDNRDPTPIEIECCRPSIEQDILKVRPIAIFGFGNVPLRWAKIDNAGITGWAGRHLPIRIGDHTCWYFPMLHPSFVIRSRRNYEPRSIDQYGSDIEFAFAHHMKCAFELIEKGLPEPVVHTAEDALSGLEVVTNHRDAIKHIEALYDEDLVGFDIETQKLRPYDVGAKILTAALAGKELSFSFPLYHRENTWTTKQLDMVEDCFEEFLYEAKCRKAVHNLAFEQEWCAEHYGADVLHDSKWGCSQAQAFILDERIGLLGLWNLTMLHFGLDIKSIDGHLDKNNLDGAPIGQVLRYNALDAKYHRLVYRRQTTALRAAGLASVYEHQLRRIPATVLTQIKGIPVDPKTVAEFDEKYQRLMNQIAEELVEFPEIQRFRKLKKFDFRPSAPDDIKYLARNILHVFIDDAEEKTLAKIKHPVMRKIASWRKLAKVHSTYIKPLKPGSRDLWSDGRVHPQLRTMQTETNRTSSDRPNSQNYPKRGEFKVTIGSKTVEIKSREVRRQMKSPNTEYCVVAFDYAGIQARNVAMESKDKALVDAFWNDYDIHGDWCRRIARQCPRWFDGKLSDKDAFKKHRNIAKNGLVFPSFFGAQPKKVASVLGIDVRDAEALHDEFWGAFPDIHKWHARLKRDYYKHGYVTGLSGFRRRAPISLNQLINSPIQADEAIIVLSAMCRLSEMQQTRFQPNMEIHDDLTYFWRKDEIDKNAEVVAKEMTRVCFPWMNVPINVEMSIGENWCDLKEAAVFSSTELWGHKRGTK